MRQKHSHYTFFYKLFAVPSNKQIALSSFSRKEVKEGNLAIKKPA